MRLVPAILIGVHGLSVAEESTMAKASKGDPVAWQEKAVDYARIMSRVKWTPVAEGMPIRGRGDFQEGTEDTGVPYSSVKSVGRHIGFEVFLKTFLAAVDVVIVYLYSEANEYGHRTVFVTDQDQRNGKVVIPADLVRDTGDWQIWLIGENRYGRLKKRRDITAVERGGRAAPLV